jgi:hypothetical protein
MTDAQPTPRLTGEAAWRAQRDAVERHNTEAKKHARERAATASSVTERERRLAAQEEVQLRALNARLGNRS